MLERDEPMVLRRNLNMRSNVKSRFDPNTLKPIPDADEIAAAIQQEWHDFTVENGAIRAYRSEKGEKSAEVEPTGPAEPDRGAAWGEFS